jgi:hypothetical protein
VEVKTLTLWGKPGVARNHNYAVTPKAPETFYPGNLRGMGSFSATNVVAECMVEVHRSGSSGE